MKIITIGVGAFGFAILNHISKKNTRKTFYAYEKDEFVLNSLVKNRENPYFFKGVKLGQNIEFLINLNSLNEFDLIILAIPAQYIGNFINEIKDNLKNGVTILNLSKGIDNITLKTPSDILEEKLQNVNYNYSVLSGGMIASELINEDNLGADIGVSNIEIGEKIKNIFESKNLKINLSKNYKNIELYSSIKNIFALYIGYLEGKGLGMSSIGFYFCELYKELPFLLELLKGDEKVDFSDFSLGGDLIATCFGNSRNRYFGKLVGKGKTAVEAESILKQEHKHAEGYYTLKGLQKIILNSDLKRFKIILNIFII